MAILDPQAVLTALTPDLQAKHARSIREIMAYMAGPYGMELRARVPQKFEA